MRRLILLIPIIFLAVSLKPAYPYWIWSPKTRKWVNPKNVTKSTPKEQFEVARSFYEGKQYEEAKREFKKLMRAFPKALESAESQYYLGLIDEAQGNLYEAYLNYQKLIDKYPFSERIQEAIEREYKIAEAFMAGKKRKALGVALPVEHPAIEIFNKVIENSSYGPLAPKAQYKLGMVLKSQMRYFEAEDVFNKVISNYPNSEWVEASKFQIAACKAAVSRGSDYDQGATQEAKEKFEEFLLEHPDAVLSRDAEKKISQLREKEAEASFNTARFYEKQKAFEAARLYYSEVIDKYSDTPWAAMAMERLKILENRK